MNCVKCGQPLEPPYRFCGECGHAQPATETPPGAAGAPPPGPASSRRTAVSAPKPQPAPPRGLQQLQDGSGSSTFIETSSSAGQESPEAVEAYRKAVEAFQADGIIEDWEHVELMALRSELGISASTHQAIITELQCKTAEAIVLYVDASAMADYQVGAQCLIRFRVVNRGKRVIKQAELTYATTAHKGVKSSSAQILAPGHDEIISARFRPEIHGHHEFQGALSITTMTGDTTHHWIRPVHFRVGREDGSLQSAVVNIDASSMRVGSFDHLKAGVSSGSSGQLLDGGDWHEIPLRSCPVEELERWKAASKDKRSEMPPPPPEQEPPAPEPPAPEPPAAPQPKTLSVGREVDNGMVLQSPQVSRYHAVVEYDGQRVTITDRGSSNGTFVNGKRIASPTIIWPSDIVGFGTYSVMGEIFWQRLK